MRQDLLFEQKQQAITELIQAIRAANQPQVLDIIAGGANVNGYGGYLNRQIPLVVAAWRGDLEMVKLLVEYGAILDYFDCSGYNPLLIAVAKGNFAIVEFLLNAGADPNLSRISHETGQKRPLTIALEKGFADIVKILKNFEALA